MKTLFTIILMAFIVVKLNAQANIYSALTIPDSMKKNADVVVREEYIKFTIKDRASAKFQVHDVYTILNEQGKNLLNFHVRSDKFEQLEDAEITVYDLLGQEQKTYSKKQMNTVAYGEGLVVDGKETYFDINAPSYPFTVQINYTLKFNGLFQYPSNYFQYPYHSIQQEIFDVEVPSDLSLRYKILNCNYQPVITHNDGKDFYHWELKNLTAYKIEDHVGLADNFQPKVLLAPNKFKYDDYAGDMSTWQNFGSWINNLYASTIGLPKDREIFYQNLVREATSDVEKAKILYQYMQNNMRYVSIQLGIGGLKPFAASFVDEKKYGDCKALSNYLKWALNAVGIKSNVVIVEGSMTPRNVLEDFPAHYFNHVILCIPQIKDSIWLECTSTTLPFAELGPFTENRKAMLVNESGGVLVSTPTSQYKNNTQNFYTNIIVDENGAATTTTQYTTTGNERDDLLMQFADEKDEERKKYFITNLEWKQPDAIIDITASPKINNPYTISAKMEYDKIYLFKAGSKYFIQPRLQPIFTQNITETKNRVLDYYFTYPYQISDTTVYHLPANFSIENLPKNKLVNFSFASYTCTYVWDATAHTLSIIAQLAIKERVVKATNYFNLLNFKNQVLADTNEKIVLQKT